MTIAPGEIVGIAGLAGSGRSELARLIYGAQKLQAGEVEINGAANPRHSITTSVRSGVAFVPEDRRKDGCVLSMSVAENLTLVRPPTTKLGLLDRREEKGVVVDALAEFDVRPRRPDIQIGSLSGGNQQKVVIAKWLRHTPKLLILDEPVQGVDVGAKADIFHSLLQAAQRGTGLLVIDSDFDNLAALCDRVIVMRNGRLVGDLTGAQLTAANLSHATFEADSDPIELIPTTEREVVQ